MYEALLAVAEAIVQYETIVLVTVAEEQNHMTVTRRT